MTTWHGGAGQAFWLDTAVMLAGQVIVGAWVSLTVIVNIQLAVFRAASLTLQLTVVVPTGKKDPDAGEHNGAPTPGQLSETVGAA